MAISFSHGTATTFSPRYFLILFIFCFFFLCGNNKDLKIKEQEVKDMNDPNDYFFISRSYPDAKFSFNAYKKGMQQAQADYEEALIHTRGGGSSWQIEGPSNINGRKNTVAINPSNSNIMLAGCATGGIFKTVDNGLNWYPVFDEFSYLSIGYIVYDPANENILYAGTGDPNISGYPFIGDGIYKSTDGGETWTNTGLNETGVISKIIVHPADANTIYVAAMGLPFETDTNRGLYKSTDGGATWNKILFVDDDAGIIDIATDPANADIIYAASWNRIRNNQESIVSGPDAHIYKSTDGGATWDILSTGLPSGNQSRISIEMSADDANTLYASFIGTDLQLGGIYKTTNGGTSWNSLDITDLSGIMGGFGWYFDAISLNPFNPDELFVLGVDMQKTYNDGATWQDAVSFFVHADKHAIAFKSENSYVLATDGGLYKTTNDGTSWSDADNIVSSQLYHVDLNPNEPGNYWAGMQDNGTAKGNYLSIDSWEGVFGGDGFHSEFRTDDASKFYVEYQNAAIVGFDGFSFFDATNGIDASDRRGWNAPYFISKFNNDVLFAATYRVYKSTAGIYPDFNPISNDLTDGIIYAEMFHNITTLEQSNFDADKLYAGTSDANVWRTIDGGTSWTNITGTLPERYVTDIACSYVNDNVVFVSNSGYKDNEFIPHINKSSDFGNTWTDISGDLPQQAINAIALYPLNDDYIFVATDGGVYYTSNGGINWTRLGDNMPVIPVYDIKYDATSNKIIAGTFARGAWTISLDAIFPFSISAGDDVTICAGDTVVLTATGDALIYSWAPVGIDCVSGDCSSITASPMVTTTYTVTGTNALGNTATDAITVYVNPSPPVPAIELSGAYLIAADIAGATYQWYFNGDILTGETNDSLLLPLEGTGLYEVVVTNEYGCTASATFNLQSGIQNINSLSVTIYPSPVLDNVFISIADLPLNARLKINIYTAEGKNVAEQTFTNSKNNSINVSYLSSGIYFIEVSYTGTGQTPQVRKVVKKFVKM